MSITTDSPSNSRTSSAVFFGVGLAAALVAAAWPFLVLPQFRSNFAAMGFDLPWITQVVLSYYPILIALPVLVLAAWWLWPNKAHRGITCLAIGLGGFVLSGVVLVAAVQYPVFQATGLLGAA